MVMTPELRDDKRRAAEAMLGALPIPEGEAAWARDARARARTRFLDAGAPIRRDEYWKYTDPAALTAPSAPVAPAESLPEAPEDPFAALPAERLRFVNGRFREDLSDAGTQPGLAMDRLASVLTQDITVAREIFGRIEAAAQEKVERPLGALSTAAATEGLVLQATGRVERPLHLDHRQIGEGTALLHHLIRVESGAALTVIETGLATNTVIEVDLAEGAEFRHIRLQDRPDRASASRLFARIAEGAALRSFTMTADGRLTRNETVAELAGDSGICHIAGAVLGTGEAHADNTVFVTHGGAHCESRQVFKNVLADRARAIFQGKIFVRPAAQKTDGYQISQSVLLDEGAEFSAKPELEIYADDVKCSHGSTTGALDPTALFYLRSRGVPRPEAESLLIASFVEEAIAEIDDEAVAEIMRGTLAAWMARRA